MITTGKTDLITNYVSYFLRLSSNVIILPFILGLLNAYEYGLWSIFVSLGAFVNLVDLGFGVVLTRYSTYAFCGADRIDENGLPDILKENCANFDLLLKVYSAARRIYIKLFFISLAFSACCGIYICVKYETQFNLMYLIVSWTVYSFSSCIQIYYVSYNCIIKGMGKVKESSSYYIVQQLIHISLALVLLYAGAGLIGLSVSTLVSTLVFRALNAHYLKDFFAKNGYKLAYNNYNDDSDYEKLYNAVKNNTHGIVFVTVSNYVYSYGITLICSLFLPLDIVAGIGITNQLIGLVGTVSSTAFSTYIAKMGDYIINKKYKALHALYSSLTGWFFVAFLAGTLCIVFIGPWALELIGSETSLLRTEYIVLLSLSSILVYNSHRCTSFIMLFNKQPHVKAYFISSLVLVGVSFLTLSVCHNVLGYILPAIAVQCAYNGWKWPIEAKRLLRSCN